MVIASSRQFSHRNEGSIVAPSGGSVDQLPQQCFNSLRFQRGPSTAEAALVRSNLDGTEKYQKISEIGKGM